MPKLSKRLSLIASLVPLGARVCDVGTDHGYLSIELIKSNIAKTVIATDIEEKPLSNARKNIEACGINNINLRLGDGLLCVLPQETDTIIIAGMGGEVISKILEKGSTVSARNEVTIILQPTTSPEVLREYLYKNGYNIEKEIPLLENNKLYSVFLVKYTSKKIKYDDFSCYIGKITPETQAGLLYIQKQQLRCLKCMTALKNIPDKNNKFFYYKKIYDKIVKYLEKFGE